MLEPFLHAWPEPLVGDLICPHCPGHIRDVSVLPDGTFILEKPDWCDDCEPDRTIKREDLRRTGLNGKKLATELGNALEFNPASLPEQLQPSSVINLGSVRHNGLTLPVLFLLPKNPGSSTIDTEVPGKQTRVILYVNLSDANISALQQRGQIPVHLPTLISPTKNGTFVAKMALPEILANVPTPEATEPAINADVNNKLDRIVATAELISKVSSRQMKKACAIVEDEFTASQHFRSINWKGRQYTLPPNAAKIIEALHDAHRSLQLPSLHQNEIFGRAFGPDIKDWPSSKTRVQYYFRKNDPKALWDEGLLSHDNKGNFWLNLPDVKT